MSLNYQISAVLITKNEAHNLVRCLDSLSFCDEIIIIDSFSTDGSSEICKQYPKVKFFEHKFLGYGPQKRLAVEKATNKWVFSIDADEWVTPQLASEVTQLLKSGGKSNIYAVPRTLIFLGQALKHCGEHKRPVVRLFNKEFANFNAVNVHEEVLPIVGGEQVGCLNSEIMHNSYRSLSDYLQRLNHYSDAMALKMLQNTKGVSTPNSLTIGARFVLTFIKIYFLRAGFLDGIRGLIWSLSSAYANAIKYAKYYELKIKKN
jgi:glycosyltransferase involved in cell wall biosynthesis